ncbi:MAG: hypothetical protein HQ503_11865 [Rhodospirillales bacterium]|nr:hypothetical protein [Rhodospirillales bacterium]
MVKFIATIAVSALAVFGGVATGPAWAGEVTVVGAKASPLPDGTYRFDVTLRHADAGWSHYADNWEILGPDGRLLARRVLVHPHEHEQPFTRSLSRVKIPAGITKVRIRGHDKVHKYGGKEFEITLPRR